VPSDPGHPIARAYQGPEIRHSLSALD
jgi:hypothetical protein